MCNNTFTYSQVSVWRKLDDGAERLSRLLFTSNFRDILFFLLFESNDPFRPFASARRNGLEMRNYCGGVLGENAAALSVLSGIQRFVSNVEQK